MPEKTLTCVECGNAMSFGASECPACGVGYRYVNGEAIPELGDDESDADESDDGAPVIVRDDPLEVARQKRPPPKKGVDGSRTAGLFFVVDGALGVARWMHFAGQFDSWMLFFVVQTVVGLALIWFGQRVLTVALLFVVFMDIRPLTEQLLQLHSTLENDLLSRASFPLLVMAGVGQLHALSPTLLLVGMPGRSRFVMGILAFLVYEAVILLAWQFAAEHR